MGNFSQATSSSPTRTSETGLPVFRWLVQAGSRRHVRPKWSWTSPAWLSGSAAPQGDCSLQAGQQTATEPEGWEVRYGLKTPVKLWLETETYITYQSRMTRIFRQLLLWKDVIFIPPKTIFNRKITQDILCSKCKIFLTYLAVIWAWSVILDQSHLWSQDNRTKLVICFDKGRLTIWINVYWRKCYTFKQPPFYIYFYALKWRKTSQESWYLWKISI